MPFAQEGISRACLPPAAWKRVCARAGGVTVIAAGAAGVWPKISSRRTGCWWGCQKGPSLHCPREARVSLGLGNGRCLCHYTGESLHPKGHFLWRRRFTSGYLLLLWVSQELCSHSHRSAPPRCSLWEAYWKWVAKVPLLCHTASYLRFLGIHMMK